LIVDTGVTGRVLDLFLKLVQFCFSFNITRACDLLGRRIIFGKVECLYG